MPGKNKGPVQTYLEGLEPSARAALERIQGAILDAAPGAVEGLSYGMPAFKVEGKGIAGFAAFRQHLSFFPMSGTVLETLGDALEGFKTSKGTVQFTVDKPLPLALVKKIVRARLAEAGVSGRPA